VPPSDSRRLREAMEKLDQDEQLAKRMGQAARERYEKLFTGKRMGEQYVQLYKKLLAEVVYAKPEAQSKII
jgi:glycosyltransferase involved in cell wall biosynthesis